MHKQLESYIQERIHLLNGEWIKKNSAYEKDICKLLQMTEDKGRYWDARWSGFFLEFKKGTSIWLDLVRYSEILSGCANVNNEEIYNLFFIPNKTRMRIDEVICVLTNDLINKIGLSVADANELIKLNKKLPHSLNAQASLTVKDIHTLMIFSVRNFHRY